MFHAHSRLFSLRHANRSESREKSCWKKGGERILHPLHSLSLLLHLTWNFSCSFSLDMHSTEWDFLAIFNRFHIFYLSLQNFLVAFSLVVADIRHDCRKGEHKGESRSQFSRCAVWAWTRSCDTKLHSSTRAFQALERRRHFQQRWCFI